MNVLITSIGRRAYLAEFFREALGPEDGLFASDSNRHAPSLGLFDRAFLVPLATETGYVEALRTVCSDHQVDIIVPINDSELPILARERAAFEEAGTRIVISSPEVVEICADKFRTHEFLLRNGILTPATFVSLEEAEAALERGEVAFPLLVKPRRGSASLGIVKVEDLTQLRQEWNLDRRDGDMVQEFLGTDHLSLHIFSNAEGAPDAVIGLRVLYKTRGECYKAETIDDPSLDRLGHELAAHLRVVGPWCVDVMAVNGRLVVLEINPRLGGGYPVSHFAGADFPKRILALATGRPPDPPLDGHQPGVTMLKQYTASMGENGWEEDRLTSYGVESVAQHRERHVRNGHNRAGAAG